MTYHTSWTDDRVTLLKTLWEQNLTALQCAARLGGFGHTKDQGRSAVIGKVHRLKLPDRLCDVNYTHNRRVSHHARPARKPKLDGYRALKRALKIQQQPALETTEAPDLPPDTADNPVTLQELSENTCRWPIGIPSQLDFHFCGGQVYRDRPYCERHARLSHASGRP